MATKSNLAVVQAENQSSEKFDDSGAIKKSLTAEIVIALCGPMGTPLHEVAQAFKKLLQSADYGYEKAEIIRLSDEIRERKGLGKEKSIGKLIDAGNELRRDYGPAVLARLAIQKIALEREAIQSPVTDKSQGQLFAGEAKNGVTPIASKNWCYIIDSIKNIEELRLLRAVYGDMLHVVGVYSPIDKRIERLDKKKAPGDEIHKLINRDSGEEVDHGQRVAATFPHSDFFLRVDSETDSERKSRVQRFLDLMLGTSIMTPTPHERAMYAAYSAAMNSACLSRQVGAALTSAEGEVVSTGWNDVPKPFGGLYETLERGAANDNDQRCWNLEGGRCFNDGEKDRIANAVVKALSDTNLIADEKKDAAFSIIRNDSQLKSLIEFSRAVHAEMHALLNAAGTHGNKIKDGKLFVTTYPCHSCARHIVAAGIREVYFLEPYRKSLATTLHSDSITEREKDVDKVRLMPFDGVAPSRYLKFFAMREGGRKGVNGKMKRGLPYPVTAITLEAIPTLESFAVRALESSGLGGEVSAHGDADGAMDANQSEGDGNER